jgi:hypothetical protein
LNLHAKMLISLGTELSGTKELPLYKEKVHYFFGFWNLILNSTLILNFVIKFQV